MIFQLAFSLALTVAIHPWVGYNGEHELEHHWK